MIRKNPMNPKRTIAIAAAVALFAYGCAQSKEAASPASAAPAVAAPADAPGASMDRSSPAPAPAQQGTPSTAPASVSPTREPPPDLPAPAAEPPNSDRRREAALRTARSELDRASRELDLATGECGSACRALASMERATGHICNLASDESDRRRCDDAKAKVARARDRIRTSCGTCPDGTRLDQKP